MTKLRVFALGEVLWDVYPDAEHLGGAPANFAFHARKSGAEALLWSRVGDDPRGERTLAALRKKGLSTERVRVGRREATGTVEVRFENGEPRYEIRRNVAYDERFVSAHDLPTLVNADVLYFGSLAARTVPALFRLRELLTTLARRGPASPLGGAPGRRPLLFYDLNLRPPETPWENVAQLLPFADVLKLNEEECRALAERFAAEGNPSVLSALFARYPLRLIILTRGANGASLYSRTLTLDQPGFPSNGSDPVGAGDAFAARFIVQLVRGGSPVGALEEAARYAAWVAGQPGAMPE